MTPKRKDPDTLERVIRLVSLAAIAIIVISLAVSGARVGSGPPDLRADVAPAGASSGGVTYEVRVRNTGGETAENVTVDVTVGAETRTLTLTAVARDDEEAGVVVFPAGTTGSATAEVVSFSETAR